MSKFEMDKVNKDGEELSICDNTKHTSDHDFDIDGDHSKLSSCGHNYTTTTTHIRIKRAIRKTLSEKETAKLVSDFVEFGIRNVSTLLSFIIVIFEALILEILDSEAVHTGPCPLKIQVCNCNYNIFYQKRILEILDSDDALQTDQFPLKLQQSSWRKIRSFIRWSPFIQVFKKHKYPWIQLAGHQGNFQAGESGAVLKRLDPRERACYTQLMGDPLKPFVPAFWGETTKDNETFLQLQDLLAGFSSPCVMDIKMGVRTYLEQELSKARRSPALRQDMYQKMVEVDMSAPTEQEHTQQAVTKPRYMQWRDQMSSSVDLGFRVEGIKKSNGDSSKDFKKTKTIDNIVDIMKSFTGDNQQIVEKYIVRLKEIMEAQETSDFFSSHEVVGSSLLFVHDADERVNVWMIDFGKTESLPSGKKVDHRSQWVEGNHEDGYLNGLDNLVGVLERVKSEGAEDSSV